MTRSHIRVNIDEVSYNKILYKLKICHRLASHKSHVYGICIFIWEYTLISGVDYLQLDVNIDDGWSCKI